MEHFTFEDSLKEFLKLPYFEFRELVKQYASANNLNLNQELNNLTIRDFEKRLDDLGINTCCSNCGSLSFVKCGKRNNIQVYQCKDCKTKFTKFTGTILEKTRYHWGLWIKMVEMVLNNYALKTMQQVLIDDLKQEGLDLKTVWLWRMKIIYACSQMPMPTLTGNIEIDETFLREAQKGSRNLVSYLKDEVRKPRYGYMPSKYGVMGAEFSTITTAIDDSGHCVNRVTGLGKLSKEVFYDLFDEHIKNPAYICTDANKVYKDYCKLHHYNHYEKPSEYLEILKNAGVSEDNTKEQNEVIMRELYRNNKIDKITTNFYSYDEFKKIKKEFNLSLARVNELHSDLKEFFNVRMTNVSSKYLKMYLGFFTYIRNWRVDNGHYPKSSADAEKIFVEILKTKANYTLLDVDKQTFEIPKPSTKYMNLLISETERARKINNNKYFKFNPEDNLTSFNKREYLLDQPKYKLRNMAKKIGIKGYMKLSVWNLVTEMLKSPNVADVLYQFISTDCHNRMDEEDVKKIKSGKYSW